MAPLELPPLIRGLMRPEAYDPPATAIDLHETHISWVLLTGQHAYKLKKPVDLGFVDFTTLEKRRHFCHEEIRLNRRYSSDLYEDVIAVTGTPEQPRMGGEGPAQEYAVRMRQFEQSALLSQVLAEGELTPERLAELASVLHRVNLDGTAVPAGTLWGTPELIWAQAADNFAQLRHASFSGSFLAQIKNLEQWSQEAFDRLQPTFADRRAAHVRECHGDLHLGNIVLWQGRVTPFDGIEFSPELRWIDTISEIAFLMMDLKDHARADLASAFLNSCLELSGDYEGVRVLPFYLVYRSLVRAKVNALRRQQPNVDDAERPQICAAEQGYLDLASACSQSGTPTLTITHGVSGSGKTTGSQRLIEQTGAIRIRSDVERKRMFEQERSSAGPPAELYSQAWTKRTYERLRDLARIILEAGFPVVVDATFLQRQQRLPFQELAEEMGVPYRIAEFDAPASELRARVARRSRLGRDASDATLEVLEAQLQSREPPTEEERQFVVPSEEF